MNNRGHIPSLFLLVACFVLIGYSLFVFVSFDNGLDRNSANYRNVIGEYDFKQKHLEGILENVVLDAVMLSSGSSDFKESVFGKIREIASERDSGVREFAGNMYGRLQNGDFELNDLENGEYEIVVDELFFKSEVDGNEMIWRGALRLKFNENGLIG